MDSEIESWGTFAALAASSYDKTIELYSVVIDLDSATDTIFANRSNAKLEKCYGRKCCSMRRRHCSKNR